METKLENELKETKMEALAAPNATFSLLVVDDEVTTRNLCRDVAADAGLQVYVASTTEEALEILEQYPIDIRGDGFAGAADGRPGAVEENPREQRRDCGDRTDPVRNDRNGHRGHAARRNGLRDEAISCGGIAHQTGSPDSLD